MATRLIKVLAVPVAILVVLLVGLEALRPTQTDDLRIFSSEQELKEFLNANAEGFAGFGMEVARSAITESADSGTAQAADYSTTNIQVQGVDEADFVKNDGRYIYTVSGENVIIVEAFPPEDAQLISQINLSGSSPQQLYINGDRLVVFGTSYGSSVTPLQTDVIEEKAVASNIFPYYGSSTTYIKIYDISDRSNPILTRGLLFNGTYMNSRMIGDSVYVIINTQPYYYGGEWTVPAFSSDQRVFPEIYYFDVPDYSFQFTNIVSVNVKDDDAPPESKVFLLGYSTALFVSQDNIYMTYQKQINQYEIFEQLLDEAILPSAPQDVVDRVNAIRGSDRTKREKQQAIQEVLQEWQQSLDPEEGARLQQQIQQKYDEVYDRLYREMDKSVVHKININNGQIAYVTKGEVPGQPLNQFSMDEHNGYFRIATTTGNWRTESKNHLYVMDGNLNTVGKIEDLAPGERIFSARFIGDRAYLVTFVRIDPLFVVDLSDPTNPHVLGELKISGVSDYLHPYDDTHIIGVGRSTEDVGERVTFKGLKIVLFDVADVTNPKEVAQYEIGDQGTTSEALYDHKAFLFSRERNLLVLPILEMRQKADEDSRFIYPQPVWQGAYVLSLTPEDGFDLRGRISHADEAEDPEKIYYYYSPYAITRSLYMDDYLYTISSKLIRVSTLANLTEVSSVELPGSRNFFPYEVMARTG